MFDAKNFATLVETARNGGYSGKQTYMPNLP